MPGEGEEVGGGRASCPARCLKVQVLENKEGRNEGSRFSNERTSSLGMGSLPLTERKVGCWGRGKTFQMDASPWWWPKPSNVTGQDMEPSSQEAS